MRIPVSWFGVVAQTSQVHKNNTRQASELQNIEQHQL